MQLPISEQPWSYLAPFRRYGGLKVENRHAVRTHTSLINRPRDPFEFHDEPDISKN